jgi:hypothetical protein
VKHPQNDTRPVLSAEHLSLAYPCFPLHSSKEQVSLCKSRTISLPLSRNEVLVRISLTRRLLFHCGGDLQCGLDDVQQYCMLIKAVQLVYPSYHVLGFRSWVATTVGELLGVMGI